MRGAETTAGKAECWTVVLLCHCAHCAHYAHYARSTFCRCWIHPLYHRDTGEPALNNFAVSFCLADSSTSVSYAQAGTDASAFAFLLSSHSCTVPGTIVAQLGDPRIAHEVTNFSTKLPCVQITPPNKQLLSKPTPAWLQPSVGPLHHRRQASKPDAGT
ncbi:hypothetical protein AOQ84DRAFT_163632 [Glonium stellatum]|uniref:Uncharacterized protein n=1 Tax=Glonium stellatum TaxID=574774 RepID=A0A8E2JMK9_9PEZI|nr:hypothetical protein AOQ84DRAFT_163632 [Glonium stellatum]